MARGKFIAAVQGDLLQGKPIVSPGQNVAGAGDYWDDNRRTGKRVLVAEVARRLGVHLLEVNAFKLVRVY